MRKRRIRYRQDVLLIDQDLFHELGEIGIVYIDGSINISAKFTSSDSKITFRNSKDMHAGNLSVLLPRIILMMTEKTHCTPAAILHTEPQVITQYTSPADAIVIHHIGS